MSLPIALMQPKLMAIGDSLYNGMRSATIDAQKTALSPPALVAQGLGLSSFRVPDLPRPVIVDLERWLDMFQTILGVPFALSRIRQDILDSIRFWAAGESNVGSPSGLRAFDNISFAGATIQDMYTLTAHEADLTARKLAREALEADGIIGVTKNVGDLLIQANARFTLAPDPELSDANPFRRKTSLEIVGMRKPERLLVSIGHNNGFIDIVLRATPAGSTHLAAEMVEHYPELVRQICHLPNEVKAIYVNLLPAPSAVSSLMPTSTEQFTTELGNYYANYETMISYSYGTYSGQRLYEIDKEILELNKWIVDQFKTVDDRNRIHFVDVFARMKALDSKNNGRTGANTFLVGPKTCTNQCFEAHPLPGGAGFKGGGLQGLDGVHLTSLGNALLASWVLEAITNAEGVSTSALNLGAIGATDTLIRNPPNSWSWALYAYRDIMRARATGTPHRRPEAEAQAVDHTVAVAGAVMRGMALAK